MALAMMMDKLSVVYREISATKVSFALLAVVVIRLFNNYRNGVKVRILLLKHDFTNISTPRLLAVCQDTVYPSIQWDWQVFLFRQVGGILDITFCGIGGGPVRLWPKRCEDS